MEQLIEFGLFAGKFLIAFIFAIGFIVMVIALIAKQKMKPDIQVENLSEKYEEIENMLNSVLLDKKQIRKFAKQKKIKTKNLKANPIEHQKTIFFLKFEGDIKATSVEQLRDEVTSVLMVAKPGDETVISIESPGGTVHGYGLGAAQILRLKKAGVTVTVCVDKVAASGGYMMACTADKIISAPFAIIGSIGVLAQVPNFHKLLKKHNVDYEEISAGDYKRTVSILGEITDKGRQKFTEQITDTHMLFKDFVSQNRPKVDASKVGTGEYWFGIRAKELNLVDELMTSDEYMFQQKSQAKMYSIKYMAKKTFSDKINDLISSSIERGLLKVFDWSNHSRQL